MSTVNVTNLKHPSSSTNNIVLNSDGTVSGGLGFSNLTRSTSQTVSGTPVDIEFLSIPAGVRRVTIMVDNLGGSASNRLLQLGSGTYTTSGYNTLTAYSTASQSATNGFMLGGGNGNPDPYFGSWVIENLTGNSWTFRGISYSNVVRSSAGEVTIGGELDRIRLTHASGTWNSGVVNIMWEV